MQATIGTVRRSGHTTEHDGCDDTAAVDQVSLASLLGVQCAARRAPPSPHNAASTYREAGHIGSAGRNMQHRHGAALVENFGPCELVLVASAAPFDAPAPRVRADVPRRRGLRGEGARRRHDAGGPGGVHRLGRLHGARARQRKRRNWQRARPSASSGAAADERVGAGLRQRDDGADGGGGGAVPEARARAHLGGAHLAEPGRLRRHRAARRSSSKAAARRFEPGGHMLNGAEREFLKAHLEHVFASRSRAPTAPRARSRRRSSASSRAHRSRTATRAPGT